MDHFFIGTLFGKRFMFFVILPVGMGRETSQTTPYTVIVHRVVGLTVGFLVASTSTRTTKLLRFHTTWIGHEQRTIVADQDLLDFLLGSFIDD